MAQHLEHQPAGACQRRIERFSGQTVSSNDAPVSSSSSPTTPRLFAWWGRCCLSGMSTGSWKAAACSALSVWQPSRRWMTSLHSMPSPPERCRSQAPLVIRAAAPCWGAAARIRRCNSQVAQTTPAQRT